MRDPEKLFADAIIGWHEACGRHDLPWQVEDWYPRLVSEVICLLYTSDAADD